MVRESGRLDIPHCKMNTYNAFVKVVLFLVAMVTSDALQFSNKHKPLETSTSISFNEQKILLSRRNTVLQLSKPSQLSETSTSMPHEQKILSRRNVISTTVSIIASSSILSHQSIANAVGKKEWKQWTCDELTPNLCDDLQVENGSINIRSIPVKYWRYRNKNQDIENNDSCPIICIHGGPGYPHNYMLPLKQLACRGNREVIFYDQAGYVFCFCNDLIIL